MKDYNPNELKSILLYIKERFGTDVFVKHGQLAAIVSDLAPNLKNERVMLGRLSRLGIIEEIVYGTNADNSTKKRIISKSLSRLIQQEYIQPTIAASYLKTLTTVFGWNDEVELPGESSNDNSRPLITAEQKDNKNFNEDHNGDRDSKPVAKNDNLIQNIIATIIAIVACFMIAGFVALSNNKYADYETNNSELLYGGRSEDMMDLFGLYVSPWLFEKELENCREITVGYTIFPERGELSGTFICLVRSNGEWEQIGEFEIKQAEVEYITSFIMDPSLSFDALIIIPSDLDDVDDEVVWSDEYTFYNAAFDTEIEDRDIKTEGSAHTHKWMYATCSKPKTCSICGETEGTALGHSWQDATCTIPRTCSRCGETQGKAIGHKWKEATYDDPKTCERCGKTEGHVKGYIDSDQLNDGNFSDVALDLNKNTIHPWVFTNQLNKCRKIKVGYTVYPEEGDPTGTYALWIRSDGEWLQIDSIVIDQTEKEYVKEYVIDPAVNIDAILFENQNDSEEEFSWTFEYSFYEAQVE